MLPGLNELAVTESSQLLPTIQNLDAFVSQHCTRHQEEWWLWSCHRMGDVNLRTSRDKDKTAKFRKLCLQGLSKLVRILSFQGLQVWLENHEVQPNQNQSKKSLFNLGNVETYTKLLPRKAQQTLRGSSRHGKIPFWKLSLCTTRVYVCVCMCTFM